MKPTMEKESTTEKECQGEQEVIWDSFGSQGEQDMVRRLESSQREIEQEQQMLMK